MIPHRIEVEGGIEKGGRAADGMIAISIADIVQSVFEIAVAKGLLILWKEGQLWKRGKWGQLTGAYT